MFTQDWGPRAAQLTCAQVKEKGYRGNYAAIEIALQYGVVRNAGKTLAWPNQALGEKDIDFLLDVKPAPELEFLQADSRFQELVRGAGLPQ